MSGALTPIEIRRKAYGLRDDEGIDAAYLWLDKFENDGSLLERSAAAMVKGGLLHDEERYEEAIESYSLVLELGEPRMRPIAHLEIAHSLYRTDDEPGAFLALERTLSGLGEHEDPSFVRQVEFFMLFLRNQRGEDVSAEARAGFSEDHMQITDRGDQLSLEALAPAWRGRKY